MIATLEDIEFRSLLRPWRSIVEQRKPEGAIIREISEYLAFCPP